MDIKELRLKSESELKHQLVESKIKLDELSFKAKQDQLKTVRDLRIAKKDVAKILTVLKEKK